MGGTSGGRRLRFFDVYEHADEPAIRRARDGPP